MVLKGMLTGAAVAAGVGLGAIEARYRRHPGNDISFRNRDWSTSRPAPDRLRFGGTVTVHNEIHAREVMICDAWAEPHLLAKGPIGSLEARAEVSSADKRYPPRADGYWTAFAVKPARHGYDSDLEVSVEVCGPPEEVDRLYAAWVAVQLDTYGYEGNRVQAHHVIWPLRGPDPDDVLPWRSVPDAGVSVRPVRTHLLCPFDDPVEVVRRYALPHAEAGDVVTLCESPLAVMQGRFYDPRRLRRSWAATRLAQFMNGEGSMGTPGGMQALIEDVGPWRVFAALTGGAAAKAAGKDGWFYRLAGDQARLIDDLPENIPPYDKFVICGPVDADDVCARITAETGLAAAVVDANNLGLVDVVGRSAGVSDVMVCEALRSNPAGNAEETTPLVLIRADRR